MPSTLVDLVKITATSLGTGAISLGPAVPGYRGVEALQVGNTYSCSIQQDSKWEFGRYQFLASPFRLVRTVFGSSNGGAPINLLPGATVTFTALATDIANGITPFGFGPPDPGLAIEGAFYYDLTNLTLYGPKTGAGWGSGYPLAGPAGATGAASAFRPTMAAFKAAKIGDGVSFYDGAPWFWTTGDYSATSADQLDVSVVKADSTPLNVGAWLRQNIDRVAVGNGLGGPLRPAIHAFAQSVRLTQFGFKGDGTTDDTAAWRQAIAFAAANQIRIITVPRGISIVTGSIVDAGNPLPHGLSFVGEGPRNDDTIQNELRYTGSGTCWNIRYPTGAGAATGSWSWDRMAFKATNPAGTMFDFNDTTTHTPNDNPAVDPYMYLLFVSFTGILAIGGVGTGDFIRASKTFYLTIDEHSGVYNWRRGLWGKGCDNWTIRCRLAGNNRNVMLEGVNTLGNNNRIECRFLESAASSFGGEAAYSVYDTALYTTIAAGALFEGQGGVAHLYLNGFGTMIEGPTFSFNIPFWQLGPSGREIVMRSPRVSTFNAAWAPLFDVPISWNFGGAQTDYRMMIADAPQNMQRILNASNTRGRVRLVDSPMIGGGCYQAVGGAVATSKGILPTIICQAANGGFISYGSIGGQTIDSIAPDTASTGGYSVKFSTTSGSGSGFQFVIGGLLMPASYKVHTRNRMSAAAASGNFNYIVTKNGAFMQFLTLNLTTSYARPTPDSLDLTSATIGDVIGIEPYYQNGGINLFLDYIALVPVAD